MLKSALIFEKWIKLCLLSWLFFLGIAGAQNKGDDLKEIQQQAKEGDSEAQFKLGAAYYLGLRGLPKSYEEAEKWYRKSALQGHPIAQTGLGTLYFYGHGVKKSPEEAVKWYRKSAAQDSIIGIYNLAQAYYDGVGVERDYFEAAKYYDRAARGGVPDAQFNLGFMYATGQGIDKDLILAYFWWEKAAEMNFESAADNLKKLEAIMSLKQLEEAKKLLQKN